MQYKIVVKHYLDILPNILISVGNAMAVWNVASQDIQSLGSVVPNMQPHPDTNDTITASCLRFCNIQQAARDTTSAKCGKHIQVLDLRNLQISKSGICRLPVDGYITCELSVNGSNQGGAASCRLLLQVQLILCLWFDRTDARKCRRDDRRVMLIQ